MRLYRPSCNLEFLAYFVVFAALEQQLRNLLFSRGQLNRCFLHEFPQIRNARTPGRGIQTVCSPSLCLETCLATGETCRSVVYQN